MAKKGLSYGPDALLIKGARDVAQSEAMKNLAGGLAFGEGFEESLKAGFEEQEKRNSIRDAYLEDLKSVDNIYKLDQDYNKKAVTDFVNQNKNVYAKAADCYARTKDQGCREKMEEIKFSFGNLNNQLSMLMQERKEYLNAYDKGQIVDLPQDNIYSAAYTNKGQFVIGEYGDIGFNMDGQQIKFKDIAGKYNVKNNVAETFVLKQNYGARTNGENGKSFYRDDTKNLYAAQFKETGAEGIMVMAKTDLTGDNEYILPNGQKAGNLSFESMWAQGLLAEKFYTQIPKGTNTAWMYDDKNKDVLNDLMSEYYTDVTEFSYKQGLANYKDPEIARRERDKPRGASVLGGFKTFAQIDDVAKDIQNKQSHTDLSGVSWEYDPKTNKFTAPGESGSVSLTGQQLLSRNGIKYLYPNMFKPNTEFKK